MKEQENINNLLKIKQKNDEKRETINNFKTNFEVKYNRRASVQEIIDNNKSTMSVDEILNLNKL